MDRWLWICFGVVGAAKNIIRRHTIVVRQCQQVLFPKPSIEEDEQNRESAKSLIEKLTPLSHGDEAAEHEVAAGERLYRSCRSPF